MSLNRSSGGSLKKLNADQKQSCFTSLVVRRTEGMAIQMVARKIGQEADDIEGATLLAAMQGGEKWKEVSYAFRRCPNTAISFPRRRLESSTNRARTAGLRETAFMKSRRSSSLGNARKAGSKSANNSEFSALRV